MLRYVLAGVFVSFFVGVVEAARMHVVLDGGSQIEVENISSYAESTVQLLVLVADRSTRDGCPFDAPDRKGLMESGDRVVVSDSYVAWLDLTQHPASPGLPGVWVRSGALTGFWSLNPATQFFRNLTSASGSNCWNWPRNELLPGSASPHGNLHWWDKYAPPTEHVIVLANNSPSVFGNFFAFHYSQAAPSSAWALMTDGEEYQPGRVRFVFQGRMANANYSTSMRHADYPENQSIGFVDASIEYQFRQNDVVTVWKFRPNQDILVSNLFTFLWLAYAPHNSAIPSDCLNIAPGFANKPTTYFTPSMWFGSSVPIIPRFSGGQYQVGMAVNPPNSVRIDLGVPCGPINHDVDTWQSTDINNAVIGNGAWIRMGESANLPALPGRTLTMVNLEHSPSGLGTLPSPINIRYTRGLGWNEAHRDGTYGMGFARGPYTNPSSFLRLHGGMWYYSSFSLSSAY